MEDGHSDDDILYSSSSSEEEAASMASGRPGVLQEMFSSLRLEPKAPPTIGVKVSVEQDWETLFALPDSPENIELDAGGGIIAATRTKLVERLTTIVDMEFVDNFLMGYRNFLSPVELSEMLSFRLMQGFMGYEKTDLQQSLKVRTFVVLRQWMRNYYEVDFWGEAVRQPILAAIEHIQSNAVELTLADQQILIKLRKYTRQEELSPEELTITTSRESTKSLSRHGGTAPSLNSNDSRSKKSSWIHKLKGRIKNIMMGGTLEVQDGDSFISPSFEMTLSTDNRLSSSEEGSLPPAIWPLLAEEDLSFKYKKRSCLIIESSGVLAEHLCLVESKFFHSLSWTELLHYPSPDDDKDDHKNDKAHSGNLSRSIDHFNQTCQWITSQVIGAASHNDQAIIIRKLIRIALKCVGYSNFNSVMQIMLALQNPLVESLNPAWKRLNDYERGLYADLVAFSSPLRNFRNVRKAMELQELKCTPCIPFTGLYLSDLASNNERPVDNKTNLIPWFKHQTTAKIIRQFRSFQAVYRLYSFMLRPELYRFLLDCCEQQAQEDLS